MRILCNKKVAWRKIENTVYIVNPETSELHQMNPVAGEIWLTIQKNKKGISVNELIKWLLSEYDVGMDTLKKDTQGFVDEMRNRGLLICSEKTC
ncbi:MAG: PqqD family protein [Elusimicrobiota bacterium]